MTDQTPDAYGGIARFYDRVIEPLNAPLRRAAIDLLNPEPSASVLDVGCGTGGLVEALVDAGAEVAGIDLSESMLSIAQDRVGDRANLQHGDATNLPFPDDHFDAVTASLFLHELDPHTREAAISEMSRVAKPDGSIALIDYRIGSLRIKGRFLRAISTVAERMAGSEHHTNWRTYMGNGGMPSVLGDLGLAIDREKITAGGNLAIWIVSGPSR